MIAPVVAPIVRPSSTCCPGPTVRPRAEPRRTQWGAKGPRGFSPSVERAWLTPPAAGLRALFPPEVARPVVRLACECPALLGRSRAPWEGAARAPPLLTEAIVAALSAAPGRRILAAHHLKPWRHQLRRHPQPPRAAACYATITALIARSTRPRREEERGLAVDAKTSRPPWPRPAPPRPARPHPRPHRLEPEDTRAGARKRFAAWAPRSGQVDGPCDDRHRPEEGIASLAPL